MSKLSPRLASQLALVAYDVQKPTARGQYGIFGDDADELSKYFDFNLSNGPIKGVTGGFLSHLFKRTSGFALIGLHKGE